MNFVQTGLDISDNVIAVFPFDFCYTNTPSYKKYKEYFDDRLTDVEETDGDEFLGTSMKNTGIYTFKETNNEKILVTDINKHNEVYTSINDISVIKPCEKPIFDILGSCEPITVIPVGSNIVNNIIKHYPNLNPNNENDKLQLEYIAIKSSCEKIKDTMAGGDKFGILINRFNGAMNGTAISSKNGQIYNNYNDIENKMLERNIASGYNIVIFNNKISAQNFKKAIQRPLLRFSLYRNQLNQSMLKSVYKYIPNIDWNSSKTETDEGILEMLRCDHESAINYVKYVTDIIKKVDAGERP